MDYSKYYDEVADVDGELITVAQFRQLYDVFTPDDGTGLFVINGKWVTDDEVNNSKVFNPDYVIENNYSHVLWQS